MGRSVVTDKAKSCNIDPEHVINAAMNVSSQQTTSRIIYLHEDVSEQSIANVNQQLIFFANASETIPVTLVISSYGGAIDEMFGLYDIMKFLPCPIHTVALGKVMSAGVLLLAAGQKGNRVIGKSARIMIHPCSGGSWGTVFNLKNDVRETLRMQSLLEELLAKETNMSISTVKQMMKVGHDVYITPKRAIELGIVDDVMGS